MALETIKNFTEGLLLEVTRGTPMFLYPLNAPDYCLEPRAMVEFPGGPDAHAMLLTVTTGSGPKRWIQVIRIIRKASTCFTVTYRLTEDHPALFRVKVSVEYGEKLELIYSLLVAQAYRLNGASDVVI